MGKDQLQAMRHSLAHIAAQAVQRIWPEAKFGVGPVIENGFYYDIDLGDVKISESDFGRIEKEMKKIIKQNYTFDRSEMTIEEAIDWAKQSKQPYKAELLEDLRRDGTTNIAEIAPSLTIAKESERGWVSLSLILQDRVLLKNLFVLVNCQGLFGRNPAPPTLAAS